MKNRKSNIIFPHQNTHVVLTTSFRAVVFPLPCFVQPTQRQTTGYVASCCDYAPLLGVVSSKVRVCVGVCVCVGDSVVSLVNGFLVDFSQQPVPFCLLCAAACHVFFLILYICMPVIRSFTARLTALHCPCLV